MPCFNPITVYVSEKRINGKFDMIWPAKQIVRFIPYGYRETKIGCGTCDGCRLAHAGDWATRITHESSFFENNCVLTLTYDDAHVPDFNTLVKDDISKFIAKLRRKFCYLNYCVFRPYKTKYGVRKIKKKVFLPSKEIRYFYCGEYGEYRRRPHYHVILFNFDFIDKRQIEDSITGCKQYMSKILNSFWDKGRAVIGELNYKSASYVARYVTKKVSSKNTIEYCVVDVATGEVIFERVPEFIQMSRRGGIGKKFYDKWKKNIYSRDNCYIDEQYRPVPRFYDKLLAKDNLLMHDDIKSKRMDKALVFSDDSTPERLKVREYITKQRLQMLKRGLK